MTIKEVAKMFNVNTEKSRAMKNKRKARNHGKNPDVPEMLTADELG